MALDEIFAKQKICNCAQVGGMALFKHKVSDQDSKADVLRRARICSFTDLPKQQLHFVKIKKQTSFPSTSGLLKFVWISVHGKYMVCWLPCRFNTQVSSAVLIL
jgi:hypothetical protein